MNLSAGLLYTGCEVLEILSAHAIPNDSLDSLPTRSWVASATDAVNFSMLCGWLEIDHQSFLRPSERGQLILAQTDYQERLRIQIEDFIEVSQPRWGKLIPHGRVQTLNFMPMDARQCFKEAGLTDSPPTFEIVKWWDKLASKSRGRHDDLLTDIGRTGERLSIEYERNRVGHEPKWQSVESNADGYDLLSRVSSTDFSRLSIEVKASTQGISAASFHITKNEWDYAINSSHHQFHLWVSVDSKPMLALLINSNIEPHIPKNCGHGIWEAVEIPAIIFNNLLN